MFEIANFKLGNFFFRRIQNIFEKYKYCPMTYVMLGIDKSYKALTKVT